MRFAPAAARLLEDEARVLLEIGPRTTLATLARQCALGGRASQAILASLADTPEGDLAAVAETLGRLRAAGIEPDLAGVRGQGATAQGRPAALSVRAPAALDRRRPRRHGTAGPAPARHDDDVVDATPTHATDEATPPELSDTRTRLFALVEEVSGLELTPADADTAWLELGLDSLALTQLALQLQRVFGVQLSFRQVMEQYGTAARLAARLDEAATTLPAARARAVGHDRADRFRVDAARSQQRRRAHGGATLRRAQGLRRDRPHPHPARRADAPATLAPGRARRALHGTHREVQGVHRRASPAHGGPAGSQRLPPAHEGARLPDRRGAFARCARGTSTATSMSTSSMASA